MSTGPSAVDGIIHRAIGGDVDAARWIRARCSTSSEPMLLTAAGLLDDDPAAVERSLTLRVTTRDRQVAAIAAAHLRGDHDLVDALARDHLVDHPDSVLVAWIASGAGHAADEDDGPRRRSQP